MLGYEFRHPLRGFRSLGLPCMAMCFLPCTLRASIGYKTDEV